MKIGIVKEIKSGEKRVASTPENVAKLVAAGHEVVVEATAGIGAGFTDEEYVKAGATLGSQDEAWNVDLLMKVKEPLAEEYKYFKKDLIIWGFLHLAASKPCVEAMMAAGTTAIAGETIKEDGVLTLLKPMSAIAGRRAVIMGAFYLEAQHEGQGILLPGIDGVAPGEVVILGGGNAAINACDMAVGLGCKVSILELNENQIAYLNERYAGKNVEIIKSTTENLERKVKDADVLISTILIPGAKPPKIVKEYMIQSMKPGSVVIDISIDQGGSVETIDKYTTHDNPVFVKHGIVHYAVPNMPGATPRTSTFALSNGNVEYILDIANLGLEETINKRPGLVSGMNLYKGAITFEPLASTLNLQYTALGELM